MGFMEKGCIFLFFCSIFHYFYYVFHKDLEARIRRKGSAAFIFNTEKIGISALVSRKTKLRSHFGTISDMRTGSFPRLSQDRPPSGKETYLRLLSFPHYHYEHKATDYRSFFFIRKCT